MEQNREPRNKPTYLWSITLWQRSKNIKWGKDSILSKWCWESWTVACKSPCAHTKNSKWLKDLNIRHHKSPRREHRQTILWYKSHQYFLGQSPKAIEIKTKRNQWYPVKLTNFCTAKETINKTERQNWKESKTEKTAYIMGEIFANYATDKGLIYKIYKQLTQLNNKKQQDQKLARRPK